MPALRRATVPSPFDLATPCVEGNEAVTEIRHGMWGVPVFTGPGVLGLMPALPLPALTLWRAGLVRWATGHR
jgi:hypothetical protein